jgi:hypothetical protein
MNSIQGHVHIKPTTHVEPPDTEYTIKREREINGECPDCGIQTYMIKHAIFSGKIKIPITNDKVESGRCLLCNPLRPARVDSDGLVIDPDEPIRIEIPETVLTSSNEVSSINQPGPKKEDRNGCSKRVIAGLGSLIAIVIAVGIALYFALRPPDPRPGPPDSTTITTTAATAIASTTTSSTSRDVITTPAITSVVTTEVLPRETQIKHEIESNVLRRGITFDSLALTDSRTLALDWLLYKDGMALQASDFNLNQRYIVALLAFEFGDLFKSNVDWLSNMAECSWDWITCNDQGKVTTLELG